MIDPAESARFTDRPSVQLANPLSQEASALRSAALPSMLRALRWNLDRGHADLRLFEIGKTYTASATNTQGLPDERRVLTLGASGRRRPATLHDADRMFGFFDLKGDLTVLWEDFEPRGLRFEPAGCHYYEPQFSGRFVDATGPLAVFGQISQRIAGEYKLRQPVWIAEVDLDRLLRRRAGFPGSNCLAG
jgi:phenylalanyl-tRNA synthetase beta chain